jgi:hypothetical protein
MDWLTTQAAIVEPQAGGASLYPFRLLAESTKYGARQTLKSGITSKFGKGIQKTGRGISKIRDFSKEHKVGIASIIRANRELND